MFCTFCDYRVAYSKQYMQLLLSFVPSTVRAVGIADRRLTAGERDDGQKLSSVSQWVSRLITTYVYLPPTIAGVPYLAAVNVWR